MSLAKSVPDGLMPQKCTCTKLREPPPVPYVPTKDEVQEEVAKLRNLEIKTTIDKDFGVAQERDLRSIPHAPDGGTGCHQEAWYLQGLQEGRTGLCGSQEGS